MKVSKQEREAVRLMYGGLCAYCGDPLGARWHVDHVEPVMREWWKPGDGAQWPERHHAGNLKPACPPCNLNKTSFPLESWRQSLERGPGVLERGSTTYRNSKRFGLLVETRRPVVFYFETVEIASAEGATATEIKP